MTATVTIDDALFAEAVAVFQTADPAQVIHRALAAVAPHREADPAPKPFDFEGALAAAAALPDLTEEEFARFEQAMNSPLPPAWSDDRDR